MFSVWLGSRYALTRQHGGSSHFLVRMAILSLAMSIALLILVLAIMSGFETELKTKILNLAPHISVSGAQPISATAQQDLTAALNKHPRIKAVEATVELKALAVKGLKTRALSLSGIRSGGHVNHVIGSYITAGTSINTGRNILISQVLATQMQLVVGESLMLMIADDGLLRRQPKVVALSVTGIFDTATELDQHLAIIPLTVAQSLGGFGDAVSAIQLFTDDVMAASSIAYSVREQLDTPLRIRDWTVSQGNLYQAIQTSRQMVLLMLFVVVAVAAMNIVTAMTMVVSNKSREIAMLMTMGLVARRALSIVLVQGLIIAILGISIGALVGVVLAVSITDIVIALEQVSGYQFLKSDIYPITYLPTKIVAADILSVCIPAFIITLLTALYPAWRATKVQPAEALRYDK